jgi:hypothetical protein
MAEKSTAKKRPARQQMLEALAETEKETTERRATTEGPEQKVAAKAAAHAVAVAHELAEHGVVRSIGELKSSVGKMLGELSDRLEEQVERYTQVQRAIAAKDQELKEIYEIQRSASTLTALIDSQDKQRAQAEQELAAAKEELDREVLQSREAWELEKKERELEIKERDAIEAKRREREKEEYRYTSARDQQQARDQFADEMAKSQREWDLRKEQVEQDLADRQRAAEKSEQELTALRQSVTNHPKELEAGIAKAVKETTARLQSESTSREQLLRQEFEGQKNVQSTRIAALEQQVKEQSERMAALLGQSEKAYTQVQEIAVRAIEGSGSTKQLAQLQQLLAEQARKPATDR